MYSTAPRVAGWRSAASRARTSRRRRRWPPCRGRRARPRPAAGASPSRWWACWRPRRRRRRPDLTSAAASSSSSSFCVAHGSWRSRRRPPTRRRPGHECRRLPATRGVRGDGQALDLAGLPTSSGEVDAGLVDDVPGRVGAADDVSAPSFCAFSIGVLGRRCRRPTTTDAAAVERLALRREHAARRTGPSVAGRLGADERAAPGQALAGEHAGLVAVGDPLVLAEQVADLAGRPRRCRPRGTSVCSPMWRYSSVMNDWQNRMTSPSEQPRGSKSEPPLPPPMGMPVSAFLKTCSKPRNLMMPR